jgi:Tol biopolymer transport system component
VDAATGVVVEVSVFGGDGCSFGIGNDTPSWSPDGSQLVVITPTSVRVVNRDGTSGTDIVNFDFEHQDPQGLATRSVGPLWAPGGKWIAFHDPRGLEIVRPDGTDRRLLVAGDIGDGLYSDLYTWTPDSTHIDYRIYVGDSHPDGFSLWSVNVETAVSHAIEVAQPYVDAYARQPITADTPVVTLP